MKKGFFLFLLLLLVSFGNNVFALDVVRPVEDFYVNDYANILSEETEKYIIEHSVNLYNKTTAQIVVVTVEDLKGASIEDYSLGVARSFGIGDSEKNNGLLLIVSKNDRKIRIEVGYGFEGLINDAKAGRILDNYAIPYLKANDWDNGILNGYKAVYKEVSEYYKLVEEVDAPVENVNNVNDFVLSVVSILLVGKIILTLGLFGVNFSELSEKIICFIILEVLSSIITYGSFYVGGGMDAFWLLAFGTILNLLASFTQVSGGGYYGGGGYSGGHYHGGGSSGHHGGGGHFGGGGASRGF